MPNALLVYPKTPITFWSYDEALKIARKKSAFPPNGLLTVAGLIPKDYKVKLVDTNVRRLEDSDLEWADVVLTSSMRIHWDSLEDVIERTNNFRKPILAGGPLPTQYYDKIRGQATFFLGEAEAGMQDALDDLVSKGYRGGVNIIDQSKERRPLSETPLQRFDLINPLRDYAAMAIQTTRGCPEHCTFCDIPLLYGNRTRLKEGNQVIGELEILHNLGWKGGVMVVDDNIVGNQKDIIPILKQVEDWQKRNGYPFYFFTQASLRMYENQELMDAMYNAGFSQVFFGLESPSKESLKFMGAQKNIQGSNERGKKEMLEKILDIQQDYFRAQAGFILGFDTDPDDITEMMKDFIQRSRISIAMVGPLTVLRGTPDYERYSKQGRLVDDVVYRGDSRLATRKLSYIPWDKDKKPMDPEIIFNRHRDVLRYINSADKYFERTLEYLKNRTRKPLAKRKIDIDGISALGRSLYYQGIKSDYKLEYWKYLFSSLLHDIRDFPQAVSYAVEGHHLITTTKENLKADEVNVALEKLLNTEGISRLKEMGYGCIKDIMKKYESIRENFRDLVDEKYRKLLDTWATDGRNYAVE